jgi:type II secretory pathway component PulF
MIATPGQLTQRAEFYYQLSQLTAAGLGLVPALQQLERSPPARSYREPIQRVLRQLAQGCAFADALLRAGQWLPVFDITLIEAGEKSGRLDQCFRLLAGYYTDRARMARQMIADLAYPVFLFHFAIFILAFLEFMGSGHWLVILLGGLLPPYVITAFLIYAGQSKQGEAWRAWVESALHPVPLLGTGRRYLALSRLAAALEALISAGVTIIEAWELAAAASGSPALRRAVLAWRPLLRAGQTPAEAVSASRCFPELFTRQYATGEISGKLDETLRRLQAFYQDEGSRKLHAVAQWVPRLIYLAVLLLGAFIVVRFWMRHFQDIQNAGKF